MRTQGHGGYTKVREPSNSEGERKGSSYQKCSEEEDEDWSPALIDGPETDQENKVAEGDDNERSSTREEH